MVNKLRPLCRWSAVPIPDSLNYSWRTICLLVSVETAARSVDTSHRLVLALRGLAQSPNATHAFSEHGFLDLDIFPSQRLGGRAECRHSKSRKASWICTRFRRGVELDDK